LATVTTVFAGEVHPITAPELDALIQHSMHTFNVPGIAVAVIKDDKVIYAKGFGVRSLNTGAKVDEHTLFGIASNSKAFTTAALAILVDEKKIKWDDKVTDIIPEFKMYSPYVTDEFTIRDLLTHRSGLGLGAGDLMLWPEGSDVTRTDIIHNLRYLKPTSSFRSKYDYDNNLYIVAGEVIARVSGMSWEDFIQQRIFQPLGMTESYVSFQRVANRSNIIEPHVEIDGKVQVVDAEINEVANAAAGINTNLNDLSKWVRMQLNGGKYGTDAHLFSDKAQQEMWSPQTILPVSANNNFYNTHFSAYGLGWGISDVNGYKQLSHTGGLTGVVTQVTMIPELKLGIVVLTNQQEGAAFSSITNTIKDSYFGMPKVDRVAQYKKQVSDKDDADEAKVKAVWATVEANQKNPSACQLDPANITGTYHDAWFGDVVISYQDGALHFQAKHSPRLNGVMYFYKGNSYAVKWHDRYMLADAYAIFSLDKNGKPTGFKMEKISDLTDFSYDFQDLDLKRVE
jgi:CubicO group peptidase (beta-lactamase class C family)